MTGYPGSIVQTWTSWTSTTPFYLRNRGSNFIDCRTLRGTFIEDVDGLLENSTSSQQDDTGDQNAGRRIHPGPSCCQDQDSRRDDADGGEGISQHVEKGRPRVEVLVVVPSQKEGNDEVGRQSDGCDEKHGACVNRHGMNDA